MSILGRRARAQNPPEGGPLDYVEPATLGEAVELLASDEAGARPLGGGTALMLLMKYGFLRPSRLVGLRRLTSDLGGISVNDRHELRLGALTTLRDLELSPQVARSAPVLVEALHIVANVRVRNAATLGGHLAHGDPHQDLPPILLAMGARAHAVGPRGSRWIPLDQLNLGYYETALEPAELLTEVALPVQPEGTQGSYTKFTAVSAEDWPALGVAVFFRRDQDRLAGVRLALSAATDRPQRLTGVEAMLDGERPSESLFQAAAETASSAVEPMADGGGSTAYKREMIRVHVRRGLEKTMRAPALGNG
jgi:aerobic carbon-monoxide dehydrogenase medium subunit